jgi:hypothetical protein
MWRYFKMDKCKWFGHKWGKYELLPTLTYKGIPSIVIEQKRVCKRCGKTEVTYANAT